VTKEEAEGRRFIELLEKVTGARLELTDEEWMSIISRERDGLPPCCANLSALRSILTRIASEDGRVGFLEAQTFAAALTWSFPSHPVPSDAVQKILDQVGYVPDADEHMKREHE
jgi:hypothetical protein